MEQRKRNVWSFSLWGLILIALGLLFLLQNLGVLPWGLWGTLWRFWPAILVLIGLNLLIGRRKPGLMLAITIVVLLGVIGAAIVIPNALPVAAPTSFSQPLQGVESAEVEIDFGAGNLTINGLPAGSPNLIEGTSSPEAKQDFRLRGSRGVLHVSAPGRPTLWGFGEKGFQLEMALNASIPIELTVQTGASDAQIDLTDLKITRLRIEAGASRLSLNLPAQAGHTEATVKAGAARLTITIPQGVAARITATTGVGSFQVDTARFPKVGGYYQSPDYATAANRVDLEVESGVSSVDIR